MALAAWCRQRRYAAVAVVLYAGLATAVMAPFSSPDVPSTPAQDLCNHVSGIIEARHALAEGQFPIRVAPHQNTQTRYPIFQFYGNLPYTLGGTVYLLTDASPYAIWKLEVTAFLALGGFYIYRCGRTLTRQPLPALVGGAVFLTAPYVLTDLHGRFAFCEVVSFMLLPVVFYYCLRSFAARRLGPILACGVSWSALALSHNVTYLYAATFFGLFYFTLLVARRTNFKRCLRAGAGFALGLALTAWTIVPQQHLVPVLRDGLLGKVGQSAWLTPLGVLLAPNVSLPVLLPTVYIGTPEHFGLQVGWPILAAVTLVVCYLRSPLARLQGRMALIMRFLFLFALTLFMVWTPFDFWPYMPRLFCYVQFSYRLLMFVVLWGSLLSIYCLAFVFAHTMRPAHVAVFVLALGWTAGPYLGPHKTDQHITLDREIANPDMGRGGATASYLLSGKRLVETSSVHPDMNWAAPLAGGLIDGMEFYRFGRFRAVLPSPRDGDKLRLAGAISEDSLPHARLEITVDAEVIATPELPPGPFDLQIPLAPAPDKTKILVKVAGKPNTHSWPPLHRQTFPTPSYMPSHLSLVTGPNHAAWPRLLPAHETRPAVRFGHPTTMKIYVPEPTLVQLPVIYYPKVLRVFVNNQRVRVQHLGSFVAVDLPAGVHEVSVQFVGIPWADRLSLFTWLGVAAAALCLAARRVYAMRWWRESGIQLSVSAKGIKFARISILTTSRHTQAISDSRAASPREIEAAECTTPGGT